MDVRKVLRGCPITCSKFKLLLSLRRRSSYNRFVGLGRNFRFLIGISRNLILVEFGRIPRLVESSRFFGYRVDVSRNLRLRFRVRATYYRVFLFITRGGK